MDILPESKQLLMDVEASREPLRSLIAMMSDNSPVTTL